MLAKLALFLATTATAQTLPPAQITRFAPDIPYGTGVFAEDGDLTYCQFFGTPGYRALARVSCRRAGATVFVSDSIVESTFFSVGDLCWGIIKQPGSPKFMVQVAENVRDPQGASFALVSLQGDFVVGESVTLSSNGIQIASGVVAHYYHGSGVVLMDGKTTQTFGGAITLSGVVPVDPNWRQASPTLVGVTSRATATASQSSPITSNKMKSAFYATWQNPPAMLRRSFAKRVFATLSRPFRPL